MRSRKIIVVLGAVIFLALCIYVFSPKRTAFRLVSPSPNSVKKIDPDSPFVLTFSSLLDPKNAYDSLTITPKVSGRTETKDMQLQFTPTDGLADNTDYEVTVRNAHAIDGKTVPSITLRFTTSARKLTSFEKSLPYDAGDYTVDRLKDGTIAVAIINPPAKEVREKALKYLSTQGVDSSKISVQVLRSAE